jgi:hypothetical protein
LRAFASVKSIKKIISIRGRRRATARCKIFLPLQWHFVALGSNQKTHMKKIICLFVLLALTSGVHADDKKKKKSAANSAPMKAPGGGGGRSGGSSGLPHMGQPAGHSSAPRTSSRSAPSMSSHAPSAGHTANPQSQAAGKSGASKGSSNPLLRKGGQGGPNDHGSNPLTKTNRPAGTNDHSSNPLTQSNRQAGGKNANPLAKKSASQPNGMNAHNGGIANNKNNPNMTRNRGAVTQGARGYNNRAGSRNWQHSSHANYRVRNSREVFHNYHAVRHDRGWYTSRYDRVVVMGGGYYYWDAGYWYPAWGYDPAFSFYVYDGPIYSYDNLPPDQVTMNVQSALQDEGYYTGDIDGQVGPKTREALGAYQTDHNLEVTSAVDEPTVESLGLT